MPVFSNIMKILPSPFQTKIPARLPYCFPLCQTQDYAPDNFFHPPFQPETQPAYQESVPYKGLHYPLPERAFLPEKFLLYQQFRPMAAPRFYQFCIVNHRRYFLFHFRQISAPVSSSICRIVFFNCCHTWEKSCSAKARSEPFNTASPATIFPAVPADICQIPG